MRAVPAYKKVVNHLNKLVDRQEWIPALDGGRLHVRSPHKALNTALQSAGALVAKQWTCEIEDRLIDSGWEHGWNGDFAILGFFHDEAQVAIRAPHVKPETYFNPTDYTRWSAETDNELLVFKDLKWSTLTAKPKDADDFKKKLKAHKAAHRQQWYWEQSPEIRHIGATVKAAIKTVEQQLEFRCPLDCDVITGLNWADCH